MISSRTLESGLSDLLATADLLDVVEDRNYITNAPRGFLYFGG